MRVLVQTVKSARVEILGKTVGQINHGYLLLIGFTDTDNKDIVNKIAPTIIWTTPEVYKVSFFI